MFCCLAGLACLTVVISIISNPPVKITGLAEARGFEPPVPRKRDNSLAVSPIRPLWHASLGVPILSDRRIERLHTLRHQRKNVWSAGCVVDLAQVAVELVEDQGLSFDERGRIRVVEVRVIGQRWGVVHQVSKCGVTEPQDWEGGVL